MFVISTVNEQNISRSTTYQSTGIILNEIAPVVNFLYPAKFELHCLD